jgi:hypothetical protein
MFWDKNKEYINLIVPVITAMASLAMVIFAIYIDREQQYVFRRQFVLERETRETIEQKLKQIEQLEIPYEESEITQKRKRLTN